MNANSDLKVYTSGSPVPRWNLAEWLLVAISVVTIFVALCLDLRDVHNDSSWHDTTDFGLFVKSAHDILNGDSPYRRQVPGDYGVHYSYAYPPFFADLLAVLVLPGDSFARYAWVLIQLAAVISMVVFLIRGFGRAVRLPYALGIVGFVLATYAVRGEVLGGNTNLVLTALLTVSLYLTLHKRVVMPGVLLGIAFVVKPFLLILLVLFVCRRLWQTCAAAVITGAVLLTLSFLPLIAGGDLSRIGDWVRASRYDTSNEFVVWAGGDSLHSAALKLFSANNYTQPLLDSRSLQYAFDAASVSFLVALLLLGMRYCRHWLDDQDGQFLLIEYGFVLGIGVTYGPLTEFGHLLLLFPGFVGVALVALDNISLDQGHLRWAKFRTWILPLLSWGVLFACLASPVQSLLIGTRDLHGHPHDLALVWTVRMTLLLLACMTLTALALQRQHAENRLTSLFKSEPHLMESAAGR